NFKNDLHEGDRVHTYPEAVAKFRFDDGTELTVQPDSIVVITKGTASSEAQAGTNIAMIETGFGDVNTDKSNTPAHIGTDKLPKVAIAPNSQASVSTNQKTGEDAVAVQHGFVQATTRKGQKIE